MAIENKSFEVLASAVRTATNTSDPLNNSFHRGVILCIDVTGITAAQTVTFTIEGVDVTTGKKYTILASAAIGAPSTVFLKVYPGLTASANAAANDVLPRKWQVTVTHSAGGNFTYQVTATTIL